MDISGRGLIEKNLDDLKEELIDKKNKDIWLVVTGGPGNGKSALSIFMARYMSDEYGFNFSLDNIAYTDKQFKDKVRNGPKKSAIIYDEGYNSYYRRNHATKENKGALSLSWQYRMKHDLVIINFQNLTDMEPDVLFKRAHGIFRCVDQGWLWFLSQQTLDQIDIDKRNRTINWPDFDFRDSWPDPEKRIPEFWEKYEKENQESLTTDEEDDNHNWLSPGKFGEKAGLSGETIRNWIKDGKIEARKLINGEYRVKESEIDKVVKE